MSQHPRELPKVANFFFTRDRRLPCLRSIGTRSSFPVFDFDGGTQQAPKEDNSSSSQQPVIWFIPERKEIYSKMKNKNDLESGFVIFMKIFLFFPQRTRIALEQLRKQFITSSASAFRPIELYIRQIHSNRSFLGMVSMVFPRVKNRSQSSIK